MRCWLFALPLLALACDSTEPKTSKADGTPEAKAAPKPTPIPPPAADAEPEPACTSGHVKALARTLTDAKPSARPDIVARGLADACQMPSYLVRYFELAQRQGPGGPPMAGPSVSEYREVLARACDGPSALDEAAKTSEPAAATALLFERCTLERFGVVDKAAYLRRRPTSVLPFVAHQWLLDQGVDADSARTVAAAVELFDRREQGPVQPTPKLTIPTVGSALDAIPLATMLYVSQDSLRTSDQTLLSLDTGRLRSADVQNHLVPSLFDRLQAIAELGKTAADSEPWKGVLSIVADEQIPYDTMLDVLYSGGRAEFSSYAFVLDTGAYEYGAVLVEPPKFSAGTPTPDPAPALVVTIDDEGFLVRDQSQAEPAPERLSRTTTDKTRAWDYAALTAVARKYRGKHADARTAAVSPDGSVPYGVVVRTLAALRGPECTTAGDCVLPTLIIASPGMTSYPAEIPVMGTLPEKALSDIMGVDDPATSAALKDAMASGLRDSVVSSGVGLGDPAAAPPEGSRDKESIRAVIRSNTNQVRYCYEKALVRNPKESGKVVISMTIGKSGAVTSAIVKSSTLGSADVGKCIAKKAKRWKFPKSTDETVVSYPFVLAPS